MTYNEFRRLRIAAHDCSSLDQFIAKEGGSVYDPDSNKLLREFEIIYTVHGCHAIRSLTGLSQRRFSAEYNIPLRTIQSWEAGDRVPPSYILDLLLFAVMVSR